MIPSMPVYLPRINGTNSAGRINRDQTEKAFRWLALLRVSYASSLGFLPEFGSIETTPDPMGDSGIMPGQIF